jgi:hypothetical protein
MEQVRARFGQAVKYVVIGDSDEERWAAGQLQWTYEPVTRSADLVGLYQRLTGAAVA